MDTKGIPKMIREVAATLLAGAIIGYAGTAMVFQGRITVLETRLEYMLTEQAELKGTLRAQPDTPTVIGMPANTAMPTPTATGTSVPTATYDLPQTKQAPEALVDAAVALTIAALPTSTRAPTLDLPATASVIARMVVQAVESTLTAYPTAEPLPTVVIGGLGSVARERPGLEYPVTQGLMPGTALRIVGRDQAGDWLEVEVAGDERWVARQSIGPNVPLAGVPIVSPREPR